MTITLNEMLTLDIFKDAAFVSGKRGRNNIIRWVTILEMLEDINQLDEGEMVMTTAFDLFSGDGVEKSLIGQLHNRKIAGIIIQTGYYLESVPEEMVRESERLGFPIIEISKSVTFSDITKIVHKHILNRQFEEIQFSESTYRKLTNIAINNEGLLPIAESVSDMFSGHISIFDSNMNMLCHAKSANSSSDLAKSFYEDVLFHYQEQERTAFIDNKLAFEKDGFHVLTAPVKSQNNTFGYIIGVKSSPFYPLEEIAVQHASTICALEFIKLSSLEEKDNQLKSDFLELLLTGNYTDELTIHSKGEALGYKIDSHDTCVAVMKIDDFDEIPAADNQPVLRKLQQTLIKRLQNHALDALLKRLNGQFVLLITNYSTTRVSITDVLNEISQHVRDSHNLSVSIGIGNYYNNFNDYRYSFTEAQEALFIIESVWKKNRCLHYKDLGLYKLLLPLLQNESLITEYHDKVLGDLSDDPELLDTLRIYLEDMKINDAAEKLYIHRHTLKYRIKKIEKVTKRKITNFKERIELELALIIHNMLKH